MQNLVYEYNFLKVHSSTKMIPVNAFGLNIERD